MEKIKRQELLERLLAKEMERMRKICFKYMRRPLLFNKIEICEGDLEEEKANGIYQEIDKKDDFEFTHKIIISKSLIDDYFNYKYDSFKAFHGITKTYYKKQLQKTVRHEIVHAFVKEVFELATDTAGTHRDASPIFLSVLYFLNGTSNHDCVQVFLRGQFWQEAKKYKIWDELHTYLVHQLVQYRKITTELKKITDLSDENNGTYITNMFQFSHRNAGLLGSYHDVLDTYSICENKKTRIEANVWEIGCCITPNKIKKLVDKKLDNSHFTKVETRKMYVNSNTRKMYDKCNDQKYQVSDVDEQLKKLNM